jgi:hypothetical protein
MFKLVFVDKVLQYTGGLVEPLFPLPQTGKIVNFVHSRKKKNAHWESNLVAAMAYSKE